MAERYWITGVQLGMLKSLRPAGDWDTRAILKSIEDDQFIGQIQEGQAIVFEPKSCESSVEDATLNYAKATIENLRRLEGKEQ